MKIFGKLHKLQQIGDVQLISTVEKFNLLVTFKSALASPQDYITE